MPAPPAFDPGLALVLNVAGTFAFGLSGGLAAVRARLDLFGVLVLAAVVALAGGVVRDVLIGVPPASFRDGRLLAAAGAAGLVCFFARPLVERGGRGVLLADAVGLAVFCVAGASKGLADGMGPVQAAILGAVTAIGGGMLRDVLLGQVPVVLREELYATPALLGAAVVAVAYELDVSGAGPALLGAALCLAIRLLAMRLRLGAPVEPVAPRWFRRRRR